MKSRTVPCVLLLLALLSLTACASAGTGYTRSTGQYVRTGSGRDVMIRDPDGEPEFIFLTDATASGTALDQLQTGDTIRIDFVQIEYSEAGDCGYTDVFLCKRTKTGAPGDVPDTYLEQIEALDSLYPVTEP